MNVILGTGQLGLAILDVLLARHPAEEIVLVNRTGQLKRPLPANVQLIAADVTNHHELECIAREADVIFSCTDVPYQQWADFYPATASALVYALSKTKARLVFADNLYSYGNVSGDVMTETMPHKAKTKKGLVRASVINQLLLSNDTFNKRVAIIKAADFIGPRIHKGVLGSDFLDRLYRHKPIFLFGNPQLPHTFTYIRDFALAMVTIGYASDAFGQVWHVPNAEAIHLNEWVKLFEKATGKKAKLAVLPKFLVRIAGLVNPLIRELYELAYQFEFPYLVDHTKYVTRFGNQATSHSIIVKDTIGWYEQQSAINSSKNML